MSSRRRSLAYRLVALGALLAAVVAGALLAVSDHGGGRWSLPSHRLRPARVARPVQPARTIAVRPRDGGAPVPVATVIPNVDAGPPAPVWPPPLLNPAANLRTAWDLALGRPGSREILFTFDDGPNPGTTDRLLNILDHYHVHAVFFVCGWRLETDEPLRTRTRNLLLDEFHRGHVIGNHTIHHPNMAVLSPQQVEREIDHNSDLIEEVIGQKPHLFRPPYGSYSEFVRRRVEERHDELTLWSVDSHDWQMVGDAQGVAMNVIRLLGNMAGGTVLLHDTHPWSVSAAQMVLRWIESDNHDRERDGRPLYTVLDAPHFFEGERARLPLIEAARAAEAQAARHGGHRDAGSAPVEELTPGNAGMGGGAAGP